MNGRNILLLPFAGGSLTARKRASVYSWAKALDTHGMCVCERERERDHREKNEYDRQHHRKSLGGCLGGSRSPPTARAWASRWGVEKKLGARLRKERREERGGGEWSSNVMVGVVSRLGVCG